MEEGVIVEEGPCDQMLDEPRDERTRQFLRRFLPAQ
jgi:ABC-type microcin C transport system duplicated ATPase subunit YejF